LNKVSLKQGNGVSVIDPNTVSVKQGNRVELAPELVSYAGGPNLAFQFTVNATDGTFAIPTVSDGTYNCNITYDLGGANEVTYSGITTYNDANMSHTFPGGVGTYTISITGTFTGWRFNNGGDKLKMLAITNWGDGVLTIIHTGAFFGCTSLTITADGAQKPTFTGALYAIQFMRDCSSVTTVPGMEDWVWSTCTSAYQCWRVAASFNQALPDMPLITRIDDGIRNTIFNQPFPSMPLVTNINTALTSVSAFDQDLTSLPWATITTATNFMLLADGISTVNYDALLLHMDSEVVSSLTVHFGSATYTGGGAVATARANLVSRGCVITDGGIA